MNGRFFIGPKGGSVNFVDEDGVVTRFIPLSAGAYSLATFQKLRAPGEHVTVDAPVFRQLGNVARERHPAAFESAANPSFRVSPAQRQAKNLQRMMARTEALARYAAKGLKAIKRAKAAVPQLEHTPELPNSDAGEVPAS